ncbi:PilN domain-containing protein [Rhodoferax saidenbachensis]|uniref:Tfp pilus assembly protein PilN n=1 Tax=Rhodoferax saidenbachensis TaxID=1484693 RepID=A0ABU1ZN28_9BURK|nr:PilN domain-containing protein [Rhodoferax saidenbachensis]MDR7306964.1 Tfp pilus assembly protein PilN [Rhodoferax saidenbachensis]
MPQQINLCTPILLTQKRYFSADTMAISLGVFVVAGALLCGVWVWNLQRASQGFSQTMDLQAREIATLQAAIQRGQTAAAPVDPALLQKLKEQQALLLQKQQTLQALQQGVSQPGKAHSDRLQLVARSIPAVVWVTDVKADAARLEVAGFTLEPSALNEWVVRLASSPLMQGLSLGDVKVERATATSAVAPGASAAVGQALWSFTLVHLIVPAGGQP